MWGSGARGRISSMTTRYSRQREAILNYLENTTEHPTAETIYEQIRHKIPNISLGTVYRNLAYLVETGQIMKIRTRNETMRFDARIREHYHLQCMICGKVEDLSIHIDYKLDEEAERQSGAKIDHHELCFVGVCKDCGEARDQLAAEENIGGDTDELALIK